MDTVRINNALNKLDSTGFEENPDFGDPYFKPEEKSLYDSQKPKLDDKTLNLWKTFKWKRAQDIFPKGFSIFDDEEITCDQIKQGLLGTGYFVSAIASAISHVQRITDLFVEKETNSAGLYSVNFIISGKTMTITVDDFFPINPKTNKPAFSQSTKNLIWPLILEKCWAKLNGSYENIMTGFPHDVLSFLIYGPSLYIDMRSKQYTKEQLWTLLVNGFYKNHIIGGSTHTVKVDASLKTLGLVPNHSYSITQGIHFSIKKDGEIRLLKLHNPWGSIEWNGSWSNKDK